MSGQLFAAIRRGKVKPGMADEFAKRVKAGALPVMQKMDGFKGYYLVAGADDTIIAVSLFTNKTVAETSTQALMPWIKENLGPLLASPTETIDGTVVVSAWTNKDHENVCIWHKADNATAPAFVRHWRNSGQNRDAERRLAQ